MSDLTKVLPGTIAKIERHYEETNEPRHRLGLSQAGHKCPRYLWYAHHETPAEQPGGRVLRLFQLGNILEAQTIKDLMDAGIAHYSCQKEVSFEDGDIKLVGHIDGIVQGLPESPKTKHLFEHKTCSSKKFKELIKKGSYKDWNEVYYWQVQFYMLGLGLNRAAVFVYNKDNSELYFERIKVDKPATAAKLIDVFNAIKSEDPPERVCPNAGWYEAKFCPYKKECFKG